MSVLLATIPSFVFRESGCLKLFTSRGCFLFETYSHRFYKIEGLESLKRARKCGDDHLGGLALLLRVEHSSFSKLEANY